MRSRDPRDVLAAAVLSLVATPRRRTGEMAEALNDFVGDVAEALNVEAVGILVRGPAGEAELLCSSSHRMGELAIYAVSHEEGPCVECLRNGVGVTETGAAIQARWPTVGPIIEAAGFQMVTAIPMLWQNAPVGALNLFRQAPRELTPSEILLGQSFAAVATLALGQGSTNDRLAGNIVSVLNGQVVIEQAKGVLFYRSGAHDMQEAFDELRTMANDAAQSVSEAARNILTEAQRRP